ncbi:MAG: DUF1249 domain-containing protein [Marinobacter sp.]|nr:DUF1249 domain-containing protein [Marinobacter sp.]
MALKDWVKRSKPYVPDLGRLGALGEGNYLRLQRLRQLAQGEGGTVDIELHGRGQYFGRVRIQVLQVSRYTETVLLEQVHNGGRWLNNPAMTVRVYHDATMAEVVSCYRNRQIAPVNDYPNRYMHHPDEKTQINAFLADWLDFCLRFGHAPVEQASWLVPGTPEPDAS